MEVLRKAPDPIFDSNLIPEFSEKPEDDDKKNDGMSQKFRKFHENGFGATEWVEIWSVPDFATCRVRI